MGLQYGVPDYSTAHLTTVQTHFYEFFLYYFSPISPNKKSVTYINVAESACIINYLEHVELVLTAKYSQRGYLSIDLTSAQGELITKKVPHHCILCLT